MRIRALSLLPRVRISRQTVGTMSYTPPYTYIDATSLAERLKQRAHDPQSVAVVDVRGTQC